MDNISKDKVLAALVRSFFEAFPVGIIDCHVKVPKEKFMPHVVKRTLLNHYETMNEVFNDIMFYPLSCINYKLEEIEHKLREAGTGNVSMTDLIRMACRTEDIFSTMVAEYKRNFESLLHGQYIKPAEHLRLYTRCKSIGTVDSDTAIALTTRTVMLSYARGIRRGGTGKTSLHQASLFRLLLEAMTVLLCNEPLSLSRTGGGVGINAILLKVCGSEHNVTVMYREMKRTYNELVKTEGIISQDDQAN